MKKPAPRRPSSHSHRRTPAAMSRRPTPAAAAADDPPPYSTSDDGFLPLLRRYLTALFFIAAISFPCAVLFRASAPIGSLPTSPVRGSLRWDEVLSAETNATGVDAPLLDDIDTVSEDVRLERVLKEATMVDRTVILTTLNAAWSSSGSTLDLFLESFRVGDSTRKLLDHLVIVTFDVTAYTRCLLVHSHCFALTTDVVNFSGEKNFMSDGYLKMMWRRIDFLRTVLEKGYDFIFTDTDILWFRDPLPHFFLDGDFQIACDHFLGDSFDLRNRPNGGFNYVRSNNRTIEFYKFWYSSRLRYPGKHDQDVLNLIKIDPFLDEIGLKIRFLDTAHFGGLCEPSKDLNYVCTMHANCCIGLSRKLHDLRVMLEDWKRFMSLPPSIKGSGLASWSVPQNCSLAPLLS